MRHTSLDILRLATIFVLASVIGSSNFAQGAEAPQDKAAMLVAKTIGDPKILIEQLKAYIRPMEMAELAIEVEAWQELVKEKVQQIGFQLIAVRQENEAIDKAADIEEKALEAKEKVEEAKEAHEEALRSGDESAAKEAEEKARKAQEATEELTEAGEEKTSAEAGTKKDGPQAERNTEKASKLQEQIDTATKEALEEAAEKAKKNAEGVKAPENARKAAQDIKEAGKAGDKMKAATEAANEVAKSGGAADAKTLEKAAEAAKDAAESSENTKTALLNRLNTLRDERTALIDRMEVVLTELNAKGGDITEYKKYLASVSGISIDWWDPKAAWSVISGWLVAKQGGLRWLRNFGMFFGTLLGFWILSFALGFLFRKTLSVSKSFSAKLSTMVQDFMVKMVRRVVLLIGLIFALRALEVDLGPILAALGAASFIVAFALQDTLGNFASGLMILVYRPFDEGDVVDVAGVSGTVGSLNLVSTTIKTFDNKVIIVPNNSVWGNVITNSTASRVRRVDMVFGIGYEDDIAKAESIMEKIIAEHELVLKHPESVIRVHELGDSSVNFICRPWVKTSDYWQVYWDVTRAVKERFDAEGVSIPFPQRDVHVHQVAAAPPKIESDARLKPTESKKVPAGESAAETDSD